MKRNAIFSALVVLTILACTLFISDGATYLIASLMALSIAVIIRSNRKRLMKITRWAKANPGKAQVFITFLEITLLAFGIFAGYNLKELGYEFSNLTAYIFGTIIVIGFLSVPFFPKKNVIAIPRVVNRHRMFYTAIALSSFVMVSVFGNRLESDHPDSLLTHAFRAIDNAIFSDKSSTADPYEVSEADGNRDYGQALADEPSNVAEFAAYTIYPGETISPSSLSKTELKEKLRAQKQAKRFEKQKRKVMNLLKKRLAAAGVTGAAAVILIVLLVLTSCVGICLILLGTTAGSVILGALIAGGSIFGIVKVAQGSRRKPKTEP